MVGAKIRTRGDAESRLNQLGITLPAAPTPLGSYIETVQSGSLLFLSGMLPIVDHKAAYLGKLGAELGAEDGRDAARIAALNALAAIKEALGTLDAVERVVRLSVFMATTGDFTADPKVADGASDLLRDVFGSESMAVRSVIGVASLPLNVPVELEITLEISD